MEDPRGMVAFGSLSYLTIRGGDDNIGNLWCCQIPPDHYDLLRNLEQLQIRDCKGITNLFASPITAERYLGNLKLLEIYNCPEMVQVIGDVIEEELAVADKITSTSPTTTNDSNLMVTIAAAGAATTSYQASPLHNHHRLFPNLEHLYLYSLPKLERFIGRWKHICADGDVDDEVINIELPSLHTMMIEECSQMERFTQQGISLTTPSLRKVTIDKYEDEETCTDKDLNGAIKQCYNFRKAKAPNAINYLIEKEIETRHKYRTVIYPILVSKSRDYVTGKDGVKIPVSNLAGKTFLLCFLGGAPSGWLSFLPMLNEAYQEINTKYDPLEVVFIPEDIFGESFYGRIPDMSWLEIPLHDERTKSLRHFFNAFGLMVVVIGSNGKVVTTEAVKFIKCYGAKAYPFTAERIKEIEAENDKMAERWPRKLKNDEVHQHELLLTKNWTDDCQHCLREGRTWLYYCQECYLSFHPECYGLIKDEVAANQDISEGG